MEKYYSGLNNKNIHLNILLNSYLHIWTFKTLNLARKNK